MRYPELVKAVALGLMIGAIAPAYAEEHPVIVGMFVYMADAARLTECRTDRSVPVAMEGTTCAWNGPISTRGRARASRCW